MQIASPLRAVVFADHEIGERIVRKLLESKSRLDVALAAIVTTQENDRHWWPALEPLARTHNVALLHYPRDKTQIEAMEAIDVFFLLSWKFIMDASILNMPKMGTVNLHYSVLPEYRGVYPVNQAIMHGESKTGVSYHWVNAGVDKGNIICQRAHAIEAMDTARTLQLRLDDVAFELFDEVLDLLESPGSEQNDASASYYSYKDFEATNQLDMNKTYRAGEMIDLLRGKSFLPHGKNLYILQEDGSKIYVSIVLDKD